MSWRSSRVSATTATGSPDPSDVYASRIVIVWINGAFGAGKTVVAEALLSHLPGARLFDPERVGFLLRELVEVPTGDLDRKSVV